MYVSYYTFNILLMENKHNCNYLCFETHIVLTEKLVFIYLVLAQQVQTVWSIRRMKF